MKVLCTLLGVVLLVSVVRADSITTIQLQNRPAEEIIPIVEPMLGPDDAISGQGFVIVLRSSPATLAQVRNIIETFDIPARILQVSVFQGSGRELGRLGISGNVQIERGDASIDVGDANAGDDDTGGSITYSSDSSSVTVDGISTQKRLRDNPVHQVRVAEGNEAYIDTGEQIPYTFGAGWIAPGRIAGGVEYLDVVTGFWVLPRIQGKNVSFEVSPFRNSRTKASGGNVEVQSASTTITGRLGDWLLVGGTTEQIRQDQRATGSYETVQGRSDRSVWIRADLVQ